MRAWRVYSNVASDTKIMRCESEDFRSNCELVLLHFFFLQIYFTLDSLEIVFATLKCPRGRIN